MTVLAYRYLECLGQSKKSTKYCISRFTFCAEPTMECPDTHFLRFQSMGTRIRPVKCIQPHSTTPRYDRFDFTLWKGFLPDDLPTSIWARQIVIATPWLGFGTHTCTSLAPQTCLTILHKTRHARLEDTFQSPNHSQ